MTGPVRVAIVGAGSMGSLHARVTSASLRTELAGIVEPDEERGRALAERYDVPWGADLDDVRADAVVVAAPTESHPALGRAVLERGLPLLMEKPLADRLDETAALVELSSARGVPLMCGLLERFNPGIMTALSLVEQPRHVTAVRHSPYVPRIRTGTSTDLLIHDADIVLRLAGTYPSAIRSSLGYLHPESLNGSEDVSEVMLTFPDGMLANLSASRMSQRKIRSFTIAEADRLVEVDMMRNAVTIYRHVLNEAGPDGLGYKQQAIIEIPALVSSQEPLAAQLDRFVDLVTGTADADQERAAILPPHRLVEHVRFGQAG
jgi:predicted dehydrogenase